MKLTFASMLAYAASASEYPRLDKQIDYWGYTWESHNVATDDDYILTAFRVTGNQDGPLNPDKPPVVIIHGSFMDAASWLGSQYWNPEGVKPFHFMLADAGYDVFLANTRGTEYARQHTTYDPAEDEEYWNFSIIEMGLYDVKGYIELANEVN